MNRILTVMMYCTNVVLLIVFEVKDILKASLSIPTTKYYSILYDKTKTVLIYVVSFLVGKSYWKSVCFLPWKFYRLWYYRINIPPFISPGLVMVTAATNSVWPYPSITRQPKVIRVNLITCMAVILYNGNCLHSYMQIQTTNTILYVQTKIWWKQLKNIWKSCWPPNQTKTQNFETFLSMMCSLIIVSWKYLCIKQLNGLVSFISYKIPW